MEDRQAVAARDADGTTWWFRVADAKCWPSTTAGGGELFLVAGRWVLLQALAAGFGIPADIIDDEAALLWLTTNGHEPPNELLEISDRRRLR